MTLQELGLNLSTRRTRKAMFLDEMNLVVPWTELLSLFHVVARRLPSAGIKLVLNTIPRQLFDMRVLLKQPVMIENQLLETAFSSPGK